MNKLIYGFVLLSCCVSCGYQMGSLTPTGVTSVAVPTFDNVTLFRDFEFDLTQAVVNEILQKTSLQVMSQQQAQTVLRGRIVDLSFSTVTKNDEREATIIDIRAVVEIEWLNQHTGEVLLPKVVLSETAEAIAERGENEDNAADEAFQDLARIIVYQMEGATLLNQPGRVAPAYPPEKEQPDAVKNRFRQQY